MTGRLVHLRQKPGQYCGLLLLTGVIVGPLVWLVGYSLMYSLGGIGLLSEGWTLRHWQSAIAGGELKLSLVYSLTIAATVTLLATTGALGCALLIPRSRQSRLILVLLSIPMATPGAVMAFLVYQIFNPGGFLARIVFHAGLMESPTQVPALVNDPYSIGILIAQTCSALPLLTLYFLKTWTAIGIDRYCLLAESLGASRWQARWRIARPMLLSRGRPLIVLIFLWNLGSYEVPLLLGRQSPQMFSVLIQRRFGQFNLLERPEAFALATTYLLLAGLGVLLLAWRRPHV